MTEVYEPVEVVIKNWSDTFVKPRTVKRTSIVTYIIDPANADTEKVQIASYEPDRVRTVIQVIDAAVTLCLESPRVSPDTSVAAGPAPQGRYLPSSTNEYVFCGPDAMWINSLAAVTRVTVTKEYC